MPICKTPECGRETSNRRTVCVRCYSRIRYQTDPKQRERVLARGKLAQKTPEARMARVLRSTGWTAENAARAKHVQDHRCGICPRPLSAGYVHDHEHVKPPKPRGLLCQACNFSLGYYEKWQRPAGLCIPVYDAYLLAPPATLL